MVGIGFEFPTQRQRCCTQCTQEFDEPSVVSVAQVIENFKEWCARWDSNSRPSGS